MTKSIRVENACTSQYKAKVEVWDKRPDGQPDVLVKEIDLDHPTSMAQEYIHSSRYLVVKEKIDAAT